MLVSVGRLRSIIRRKLLESSARADDVVLSDGSTVPFGSSAHVADMQAVLTGLETLKKQHRYGTAARSKFADAGSHLKRLIDRSSRQEEPKTFAQLEDDHGGLGRGSPGLGQYDPGFDRRK